MLTSSETPKPRSSIPAKEFEKQSFYVHNATKRKNLRVDFSMPPRGLEYHNQTKEPFTDDMLGVKGYGRMNMD